MEIVINDKKVTLKYGFRALMIYENITQKSFNPQGLTDVITFFYSVVVASSGKEDNISFDSFIDWIDLHPGTLNDFSQWLTDVYNHQAEITNKEVSGEVKPDEGGTEKN